MLSFKKFQLMLEELTPEQKLKVSKWSRDPEAIQATDHFFGQGVDEHYSRLGGTQNKSEIHKKIESHLGHEISHDDYRAGYTKDKYNRQVKIGGLLKKSKAPQELSHGFENDSTRQGKKFTGLTVRTSRSPEGVAGQTSRGQSWENESCKNFETGSNKHYLEPEVKHGSVVSYLHDHEGKEIARATLHPHINDVGHRAYDVDSHYGIDHQGFKEHVKKIAEQLSGHHKGGSLIYTKHPDVYDDNGKEEILHPNIDEKAINDRYDHIDKNPTSHDDDEKSMLLQHPKLHQKHIDKIVNDPSSLIDHTKDITKNPNLTDKHISKILHSKLDPYYKTMAAQHNNIGMDDMNKIVNSHFGQIKKAILWHKKLTHEHISKLLDDESPNIRESVISNPNANSEHIHKALNDEEKYVRQTAIQHPNVNSEHIHKALNDEDWLVRNTVYHNEHANHLIKPEHIDKGLDDHQWEVRRSAIMHPNATKEHISKAMNDEMSGVRSAAAIHKNATSEHIHKALDDEHIYPHDKADIFYRGKDNIKPEHIDKGLNHKHIAVREEAIRHPNATPDNLIKAINHPDMSTQITALEHKNVDDKVINHALGHSDTHVRRGILTHPNIKPHHIDIGMDDNEPHVRAVAVKHPNVTHEHILRGLHDPNVTVKKSAQWHDNIVEHIKILNNMTTNEQNAILKKHGLPLIVDHS